MSHLRQLKGETTALKLEAVVRMEKYGGLLESLQRLVLPSIQSLHSSHNEDAKYAAHLRGALVIDIIDATVLCTGAIQELLKAIGETCPLDSSCVHRIMMGDRTGFDMVSSALQSKLIRADARQSSLQPSTSTVALERAEVWSQRFSSGLASEACHPWDASKTVSTGSRLIEVLAIAVPSFLTPNTIVQVFNGRGLEKELSSPNINKTYLQRGELGDRIFEEWRQSAAAVEIDCSHIANRMDSLMSRVKTLKQSKTR